MHLPSRQTKEPENTAEIIGDSPPDGDAMLESMVKNTGCLDLDDQGHWDYHGHSSGMVFLQKLKEQFGDRLESEDHGHVFARARHHPPLIFDSPRSGDSPMDSGPASSGDLPPKAAGRLLCEVALDDAMALMRFIHQPTFYAIFDRIYDTPHSDWTDEEHKHLPLLYSVMALGSMFAKSDNSKLTLEGYETSIEVG